MAWKYLKIQNVSFYSYIVFGDECILKNITIRSNNFRVVNFCNLYYYLINQVKCSKKILTNKKIVQLYKILFSFTMVNDYIKAEHIDEIQKLKEENRQVLANFLEYYLSKRFVINVDVVPYMRNVRSIQ